MSEHTPSVYEQLKEFVGDCLVVVLGIIMLIHLILFFFYGWIMIGEPNRIIWGIEVIMALGIIGFGIERGIKDRPRG